MPFNVVYQYNEQHFNSSDPGNTVIQLVDPLGTVTSLVDPIADTYNSTIALTLNVVPITLPKFEYVWSGYLQIIWTTNRYDVLPGLDLTFVQCSDIVIAPGSSY
jgi:hypothetical protein